MTTIELPATRLTPEALDQSADSTAISDTPLASNVASWQFSLDAIQGAIARYTPEGRHALVAAFRWCTDPAHPLSFQEFCRIVEVDTTTLWRLLKGKYQHPTTKDQMGPSTKLVESINRFLSRESARMVTGQDDFVLTPTAKKIVTYCDLARESRTIVILVGPSHVGKTWALERHYQPKNNHGATIYCRMRAAGRLGGMIQRIAGACNLSDRSKSSLELLDRIKHALSPEMLLILDEVHLLAHTLRADSFHNCMETIREIHDEAKCGMVLSFTMLDAVQAASQKQLQQIWRRGVHKFYLPTMPTKGDVTAICNHHGLEFPNPKERVTIKFRGATGKIETVEDSPYHILKQVGRTEALKAITERIRYAKLTAKKLGQKLSWAHFVQAHLTIQTAMTPEGDWTETDDQNN